MKSGLDSLDWSSIKFENQKREAQLNEWFLNGEVDYLQKWAFAFAERKAEYVGMPLDSKRYIQLQIMTRSRVFSEFYDDFQKLQRAGVKDYKIKLVRYKDIDRLVEVDLERLTRPSEENISPKKDNYSDDFSNIISVIENSLLEYLSNDEISLLREASFEYAEEKARKLKLARGSCGYKRLHIAARYELLCEAEESLVGFSSESFDFCEQLVRDLAEHNDLEKVLGEYDSVFVKASKK